MGREAHARAGRAAASRTSPAGRPPRCAPRSWQGPTKPPDNQRRTVSNADSSTECDTSGRPTRVCRERLKPADSTNQAEPSTSPVRRSKDLGAFGTVRAQTSRCVGGWWPSTPTRRGSSLQSPRSPTVRVRVRGTGGSWHVVRGQRSPRSSDSGRSRHGCGGIRSGRGSHEPKPMVLRDRRRARARLHHRTRRAHRGRARTDKKPPRDPCDE